MAKNGKMLLHTYINYNIFIDSNGNIFVLRRYLKLKRLPDFYPIYNLQ